MVIVHSNKNAIVNVSNIDLMLEFNQSGNVLTFPRNSSSTITEFIQDCNNNDS